MVYLLLPFWSYISWLQKAFPSPARPSDPDTMTNAAVEATRRRTPKTTQDRNSKIYVKIGPDSLHTTVIGKSSAMFPVQLQITIITYAYFLQQLYLIRDIWSVTSKIGCPRGSFRHRVTVGTVTVRPIGGFSLFNFLTYFLFTF